VLERLTHTIPLTVIASVATAAVAAAAFAHGGHTSAKRHKPTPDELAAFKEAKPAFERHCFRCHTTVGKKAKRKALEHMSMDAYPFGGHHAGEAGKAVRQVLGVEGGASATMPADDKGAVAGDDLAKIVAWAAAFDRAQAAGEATAPTKEGHHAH
jgi:uncharacterized membrane protein